MTQVRIKPQQIAALVHETGVQADLDRRAENVRQHARAVVPVRTGRLRDSIRVETRGTGRAVGSRLDYALDVEMRSAGVPPRPYLRSSLPEAGR